jgi:hypothetical protein
MTLIASSQQCELPFPCLSERTRTPSRCTNVRMNRHAAEGTFVRSSRARALLPHCYHLARSEFYQSRCCEIVRARWQRDGNSNGVGKPIARNVPGRRLSFSSNGSCSHMDNLSRYANRPFAFVLHYLRQRLAVSASKNSVPRGRVSTAETVGSREYWESWDAKSAILDAAVDQIDAANRTPATKAKMAERILRAASGGITDPMTLTAIAIEDGMQPAD